MTIRFGVVGTNWITDRFLSAAKEVKDFELTAVFSRTEERAQEFASKHGVDHTFTDLDKMAATDLLDAVYIATPNSLHTEQSILFMKNGKHVLCEKPMASNTAEIEKMIQVATKEKVLLMEAMKTTFLPNFISIQENLHKIGKVRRFVASKCQYSSRYDSYKKGEVLNAFRPEFSNGSLMDLGVYCVFPMVALFGEPKHIKANGVMLGSGVDAEGSILFGYEEMEAITMHSKITNSYAPSEIQGEEGSIIIDDISNLNSVEIRYRDGTSESLNRTQDKESMFYETEAFVQLVQQGMTESNINSFERSWVTASLMEEARKQIGLIFPADRNNDFSN
ncbi:Gfo/Idh/MocA family oxidoreductase [Bacillaceae bacterium S4-13-58]